ncbi:hypothetical protein GOODEAATRI_011266 [Goodea atripinnis]|uniref:Uncharacterized protein n=1 Tax=Goodea atripinnis TaxID=208336 RepID=A0ABV0N1W9_9TELE
MVRYSSTPVTINRIRSAGRRAETRAGASGMPDLKVPFEGASASGTEGTGRHGNDEIELKTDEGQKEY